MAPSLAALLLARARRGMEVRGGCTGEVNATDILYEGMGRARVESDSDWVDASVERDRKR